MGEYGKYLLPIASTKEGFTKKVGVVAWVNVKLVHKSQFVYYSSLSELIF